MCGLLGAFAAPRFNVEAGLARIRHRGPDAQGVASSGPAVHGHVRLALVDLTSASDQPFRRGEGLLSFNGEIWNWRAVRAALEAEGETFATRGDTEVLAAALDRWGVEAALPRLEGMFAFAWSKGRTHVLVRDRYGKVPLYVHRRGGAFLWSSERKGLGREYPAAALPPGTVLDLTTGRLARWYALPRLRGASPAGILAELRHGVAARLAADAPVCCLVSGGLDSSLILALCREVRRDVVGYTAVLDPEAADLKMARRVCAHFEVPLVEVPVPNPGRSSLAEAVEAIEIPSKAQVEIAALCLPLARRIAADGFKACLSGEAADELFGGYGSMCIKGASADDEGWRAIRVGQVEKMARGNFVRCNKAFMAHGVECRLPFMERPLVERVLSLPKQDCPPGKGALKAAALAVLPREVVKRPKDTFQGGSGMAEAAGRVLPDPAAFYRAEVATRFGAGVKD